MTKTSHRNSKGRTVDLQRTARLNVRISQEEREKFEKLARAKHTDLSELVRQKLHEMADAELAKGKAA